MAGTTGRSCPFGMIVGRPVLLDVALSHLTLRDVALSHCLAVPVGHCLALLDVVLPRCLAVPVGRLALLDVAVCSGLDLLDVLYLVWLLQPSNGFVFVVVNFLPMFEWL